ncbi:(2Fe-2S)-binding protein [Gordonia sinesedis]
MCALLDCVMTADSRFANYGPFFAVQTHLDAAPAPPWRPLSDLVDDPAVLDGRTAAVRAALAATARVPVDAVEVRVAASVTHLGLVARLVAPMLAAAATGTHVDYDAESLWWQDELGGPYPLSVSVAGAGTAAAAGPPAVVGAITDAVASRVRVSRRVLGGNVASAVNSAARMMATARPDIGAAASRVADAMLADPALDGGTLRSGPGFRRRSCCLIYRIAGDPAAVCGDCVLAQAVD